MNFLAHATLASDAADEWGASDEQRQGLLAGAILGDFVKGRIKPTWPEAIQRGVWLHRKLDAQSNRNSNVGLVSNLYPADLRRYAPIFIDLLADYHLSNHWETYNESEIDTFCMEVYQSMAHYEFLFDDNAKRFSEYMVEANLLATYHQWPAIRRGLHSVVRRLNQRSKTTTLETDYIEQASKQVLDRSETELLNLYTDLQSALPSWANIQLNFSS